MDFIFTIRKDCRDTQRWSNLQMVGPSGRSPAEIVSSNPTGAWGSVCCECCVLSGRGLCDGLITRPEESYRLWRVVVCDLETSWMRRPWPTGGLVSQNKYRWNSVLVKTSFVSLFVWFWRDSPQCTRASSFTRFLDHTQRRTTVGRTPLDEWSARHRDLYLTSHNTHNRQISMPPL